MVISGKVGVGISHIHCKNQGGQEQKRAGQGVKVTILRKHCSYAFVYVYFLVQSNL